MSEYFIRHGQTDWNVEHKIQGRIDIPLNDAGRKQAKKIRDDLRKQHFDVIFASPLIRAKETADIIAEPHKSTPLLIANELAERNFGDYEGKYNNGDYYGLWQYNNADTPNGETPKDLEQRVFPFLDRIRHEYKGKSVLLVAHGGVGLVIESYYRGVPEDGNLLEYVTGNGELRAYDIEQDT